MGVRGLYVLRASCPRCPLDDFYKIIIKLGCTNGLEILEGRIWATPGDF